MINEPHDASMHAVRCLAEKIRVASASFREWGITAYSKRQMMKALGEIESLADELLQVTGVDDVEAHMAGAYLAIINAHGELHPKPYMESDDDDDLTD